ncbi:D-alanyl-D-alanine carboxypeptidase family protein [Micromonospora chokoriensis]
MRTSVPLSLKIPGELRGVPWPKVGQARLDVIGIGSLGESGSGRPVPIGSVAKVMTAYVVLSERPLGKGDPGPAIQVTAEDVEDYRRRVPAGESLVEVAEGEPLTQRQALEALLLPSANNVAAMLAKWNAGSVAAFVRKMNATAAQLGMTNTRYTDPSGLAPTTVSTAADQTVLARHTMQMPTLAQIVAQENASIPTAGLVRNYNDLLGSGGVVGIKTGSTDEAGGNLSFAARINVGGRTITVVGAVLGQPGENTPEQLTAVNVVVRGLLAAVRKLVKVYQILPAGVVGELVAPWGERAEARTGEPVRIVGWPGLPVDVDLVPIPGRESSSSGSRWATLKMRVGDTSASVAVTVDAVPSNPSWRWRLTRRPAW